MTRKSRRKKKSAAARLRPFWFLIALVAAAAAFGGYYAATWPGFFPKNVAVAGNRIVPSRTIAAHAAIVSSQNVWLQNMRAAAARVAAIPYIKDVEIHRSLPASVKIQVSERKPYARVRYADGTALVDSDLRVLQAFEGASVLPLFVTKAAAMPAPGTFIKDPVIVDLHNDYDALLQTHVVVASLQFDKFGDLTAKMRSGVELLLGDDANLPRTAPLVAPILSQVAAGGKKIAAVDLRAPKTPVVVYK